MKKIKIVLAAGIACAVFAGCGNKNGLVLVKGGTFSASDIDKWGQVKVEEPKEEEPGKEGASGKEKDSDSEQEEVEVLSGNFSLTVGDFMIGKHEVTQELYEKVMTNDTKANAKPAYFAEKPAGKEKQGLRPVERLTWYDCLYFCNRLSEQEGLEPVYKMEDIDRYSKDKAIKRAKVTADFSKNGYRLPTYAEWVWAAIGGTKGKGMRDHAGTGDISDFAWHVNNSGEISHQVGLKKPNELGLYDMTGNVCEWCYDYFWPAFKLTDYVDFTGPETGRYRYIPGGCFTDEVDGIPFPYGITEKQGGGNQALRYYNIGFRLARSVPKKK